MNYLPKCLFVLAMLVIILIGFPSTEMMTSIPTTASYEDGKLTIQLNQDFINSMSVGEKSKDISIGGSSMYIWCGERPCNFGKNKIELPPETIILNIDRYGTPPEKKDVIVIRHSDLTSILTGNYKIQTKSQYYTIVSAENLTLTGNYITATYDDIKKDIEEKLAKFGNAIDNRVGILKELGETIEQIQGKYAVRKDDNLPIDEPAPTVIGGGGLTTSTGGSVSLNNQMTHPLGAMFYLWCGGERPCNFGKNKIELPPEAIILSADMYDSPDNLKAIVINRGGATSTITGRYNTQKEAGYRTIVRAENKNEKLTLSSGKYIELTYDDVKEKHKSHTLRWGVYDKRAVIFKEIMETMEQIQGKNVARKDDNVQLDNNDNIIKDNLNTTEIKIEGDRIYIWCGKEGCKYVMHGRDGRGRQIRKHIKLPSETIILNIDKYGSPPKKQEAIVIGGESKLEGEYTSVERTEFYVIIQGNMKLIGANDIRKSTYKDIINDSDRVLIGPIVPNTNTYRRRQAEQLKMISQRLMAIATGHSGK